MKKKENIKENKSLKQRFQIVNGNKYPEYKTTDHQFFCIII